MISPERSESGFARAVCWVAGAAFLWLLGGQAEEGGRQGRVSLPVTNLVARPEAEAAISATGSVINTFAPGIGSIVALALGGLYHGYRQVRNRKVNEALVQGVETARAVLTTTPQSQWKNFFPSLPPTGCIRTG